MKLLLICTVITLVAITDVFSNKGETIEFGENELKDYASQAKYLVDKAYAVSRNKMKSRMKRDTPNLRDLISYFKQPIRDTRTCIRRGDYMDVTLQLINEKLKEIHPSPFNVSDVLTDRQKEIVNKLTGCAYQFLPKACPNSRYRSITGECNNLKNPSLGASNKAFKRCLPPEYEDGVFTPRGWDKHRLYNNATLPKPREVSNKIARYPEGSVVEDKARSRMFSQFGQLVVHDCTLAPDTPSTSTFYKGVDCDTSCVKEYPCFPITIPKDDPRIKKQSDCIPFFRSAAACNLESPQRQQINALTPYIEASQVYGSDMAVANKLRNKTGNLGLMAVNQNFTDNGRAFLPFNEMSGDPCIKANKSAGIPCFVAGDTRVNEQISLSAVQTMFLRGHNIIATELHKINPHWCGEVLYQETRHIIGSMIQKFTYSDWLPKLFGKEMYKVLPPYTGYNDTEDPRIANVFAVVFRAGHAMVYPEVDLLNKTYHTESSIPLHKTFFASWMVIQGGVDSIIRGLIARANKLNVQNHMVDDELREKLFLPINPMGLDLASFNIQRGRDHGIPGYNAWREWCGLSTPQNLEELAKVLNNTELAKKLLDLYKHPNNMDIWIAAISEPLVEGGRVGELLCCILGDQFKRTRDGDRLFYKNGPVFTPEQRSSIDNVTLSRIICDTTGIKNVPLDVFLGNENPKDFVPCSKIPKLNLHPWKENPHTSDKECKPQ